MTIEEEVKNLKKKAAEANLTIAAFIEYVKSRERIVKWPHPNIEYLDNSELWNRYVKREFDFINAKILEDIKNKLQLVI